jgi:hypothetical protein
MVGTIIFFLLSCYVQSALGGGSDDDYSAPVRAKAAFTLARDYLGTEQRIIFFLCFLQEQGNFLLCALPADIAPHFCASSSPAPRARASDWSSEVAAARAPATFSA